MDEYEQTWTTMDLLLTSTTWNESACIRRLSIDHQVVHLPAWISMAKSNPTYYSTLPFMGGKVFIGLTPD